MTQNRQTYWSVIFRMCREGGIKSWNIVLMILRTGMKK